MAIGDLLYGGYQGGREAQRESREVKGWETDQAIREERLKQDKELFPTRKATAEIGVEDARDALAYNRQIRPLNVETTQRNNAFDKLTKEEQTKVLEATSKAREQSLALNNGIRDARISGNWQLAIDALGGFSEAHKGATATRNDADGSITINTPDGKNPMVFRKGGKWPDGTPATPEDQLQNFLQQHHDPMKAIERVYGDKVKAGLEQEKQTAVTNRAVEVAGINQQGRDARQRSTDVQRERQMIPQAVSSVLKTKELTGGFTMGFSNADDAPLVALINEGVRKEVDAGSTAQAATNKVVNEVSGRYKTLNDAASVLANRLNTQKIDYRNEATLRKAAEAGNATAAGYLQILKMAREQMGLRVEEYLRMNVRPSKQ